jgi:hypothetical protein
VAFGVRLHRDVSKLHPDEPRTERFVTGRFG